MRIQRIPSRRRSAQRAARESRNELPSPSFRPPVRSLAALARVVGCLLAEGRALGCRDREPYVQRGVQLSACESAGCATTAARDMNMSSFFNSSERVAPGQPPRSGMGTDGRVMTPLPASLSASLSHQPAAEFFKSPSQDFLPSGKRRSNLHDLASQPAGQTMPSALKSFMVATTPQAQSKTDPIMPPGPDAKRRRGAASELSAVENKSVRAVSFNEAGNIEHSPAAMLESHLLPSHGYVLRRVPCQSQCADPRPPCAARSVYTAGQESDEEQGTGLSRAEPSELQHAEKESDNAQSPSPQPMHSPTSALFGRSEERAIPAANFGVGILNCEAENIPAIANDNLEEQSDDYKQVSHQEQTQQKTPLLPPLPLRPQQQENRDAELEQELQEDDFEMAEDADNVDESQGTMLAEDAVKAMPQAAKLHTDSMEKMVGAGQDAGQAICSIVQELYAAILSSLTKYADEVSQKAIAIGDERANQSNQQAKIDQTYEQTSQVAGIMQVTERSCAHPQTDAGGSHQFGCTLRCTGRHRAALNGFLRPSYTEKGGSRSRLSIRPAQAAALANCKARIERSSKLLTSEMEQCQQRAHCRTARCVRLQVKSATMHCACPQRSSHLQPLCLPVAAYLVS